MKTIIFDMYGVIIKDPTGGLVPYLNSIFPALTYADVYYPHWKEACAGGISSLEFFGNVGFTGDLKKAEKDYLDTIEFDNSFFDVVPIISKNCRLALLSNDLSEWSKYLRTKFEIDHYFEAIVVSGDVGLIKPDVRIFNRVLEKLGCAASDCIYVDDRIGNLSAAQALGMDTILFNDSDSGYDGKRVGSFCELADILNKLPV